MDYETLQAAVNAGTLREAHTSLARGYVPKRHGPVVETYKGRFGRGYTVKNHNPLSGCFCLITYFLEVQS